MNRGASFAVPSGFPVPAIDSSASISPQANLDGCLGRPKVIGRAVSRTLTATVARPAGRDGLDAQWRARLSLLPVQARPHHTPRRRSTRWQDHVMQQFCYLPYRKRHLRSKLVVTYHCALGSEDAWRSSESWTPALAKAAVLVGLSRLIVAMIVAQGVHDAFHPAAHRPPCRLRSLPQRFHRPT